MGLAVGGMKGSAADWALIKEAYFQNFEEFERAFCDRFWGVDKQRDLYLQLNYGRYDRGSRSEYFLDLVRQAGFLTEKISVREW